jgi:acetyl esterase/lipase
VKLGTVVACLLVLAGCGGESSAEPEQQPVVLLIHGGGFVVGDPSSMETAAELARDSGMQAVLIEYRLGNIRLALEDAIEAARQYGPDREVYALGESAGGTLAALLAQRGLVDKAAANAPVADLVRWRTKSARAIKRSLGNPPREVLSRFSPALRTGESPILALGSRDDEIVPPGAARRWASRDPRVRFRFVEGGHVNDTGWAPGGPLYVQNTLLALRWLRR